MSIATESQTTTRRATAFSFPAPGAGVGRRGLAVGLGVLSLLGAAVLLGVTWQLAAMAVGTDLPGPIATMDTFWRLVSNPFFDNGPNDKGIGLQVYASLQRVFIGFAAGSAVAIPLGVLLGSSRIAQRLVDPIVEVLRPVSPLAWFPIGLVALSSGPRAAIFAIFITSLWPTAINTAFGVRSIPRAHKDVARVFEFSRWRYLTKIVLPYSLPHIIVGLRLSMGIAWLVIVAAEMLSGGTGIGFYVWDSWNSLNVEQILSAILIIGVVGLALDRVFAFVAGRFAYAEVS